MTETTRKITQEYFNAFSEGDTDRLLELVSDDYIATTPMQGIQGDREGLVEMARVMNRAFPDQTLELGPWVEGNDDRLAVRFIATGVHKGEFLGVAPTNKEVEVSGLAMLRFKGDKIVEDHTEFDAMGLMTQIGALPEMSPASA